MSLTVVEVKEVQSPPEIVEVTVCDSVEIVDTTVIPTVIEIVVQGVKGDKGDKGDQGDQGPVGPPGGELALTVIFASAVHAASLGELIKTDSSAGGFPIVLPVATALNAGQLIVVKDGNGSSKGSNKVTITPLGGQTIDGLAAALNLKQSGARRLRFDGVSDWMIV